MKQVIFVLGMHRSGTSVLTGLLSRLGLKTGEHLLPPQEDNPKGFFEDSDFVAFNDKLLNQLALDWSSPLIISKGTLNKVLDEYSAESKNLAKQKFLHQSINLVKDPRFSVLMPFWQKTLEKLDIECRFIWMIRSPSAVSHSLSERNQIPAELSESIWRAYNFSIMSFLQNHECLLLNYEQLLEDPVGTCEKLSDYIHLGFTLDEIKTRIDGFVEPTLCHDHSQSSESLYVSLRDLHGKNLTPDESRKLVDKNKENLAAIGHLSEYALPLIIQNKQYVKRAGDLQLKIDELRQENTSLQTQNANYLSDIQRLELQYSNIVNSKSWQITSPLRSSMLYLNKFVEATQSQWSLTKILVAKFIFSIKTLGVSDTLKKVKQKLLCENKLVVTSNPALYRFQAPSFNKNIQNEIESFSKKPLISIIMPVFNVEPKWLKKAIDSVENQWYPNWELCIADDNSTNPKTVEYLKSLRNTKIKITFLQENLNISGASNAAADMAQGEYLALMDNDDEITPDALYEVVKEINNNEPDFIYSDEDKISETGEYCLPFFKPDYSYDLLLSANYICHFSVFKKSLVQNEKVFNSNFDGAQDYDLFLRLVDKTQKISHISKVLYHWRMIETSTALNPESKPFAHIAAKNALQKHLENKNGIVTDHNELFNYDIRYDYLASNPKVSIIIPTKDGLNLLSNAVTSILTKSTYNNYEIIILDNNSTKPETFKWFEDIQKIHSNIKVVKSYYEFNWSKLNNQGITEASGDVYIFLNNDIEIISPDWIERLSENALRPNIGTVGALLLYKDETIQHAGIVLGMGGWADHVYKEEKQIHMHSPFVSPMVSRNVLASTGACLCISKQVVADIGLFNEEFKICGSDVEISLRAFNKGYRNLYNAQAKLYHLESKTRDSFVPECDFVMSKMFYEPFWKNGDPFFNKNLNLNSLRPIVDS
ncbi:glycosyltransferase [Thiomicrorhabdus indica]|uniref:glycosyltransferase n=1 Tax=Thiomicrorhabdus indica TaxID=2267253 RepID=UPI002AA70F2F|nr:glycosyltransferase [Thiomicrorhabdus indica]